MGKGSLLVSLLFPLVLVLLVVKEKLVNELERPKKEEVLLGSFSLVVIDRLSEVIEETSSSSLTIEPVSCVPSYINSKNIIKELQKNNNE